MENLIELCILTIELFKIRPAISLFVCFFLQDVEFLGTALLCIVSLLTVVACYKTTQRVIKG